MKSHKNNILFFNINKSVNKYLSYKYINLNIKYITLYLFLFLIIILLISNFNNKLIINKKYKDSQNNLNITFQRKIKHKIKIAIYGYCIINGGRARITSILINHFYNIKFFKIYLFTVENKEDNEYYIPENVKRFVIKNDLVKILKKNKIDILIYELDYINEIEILNNLNKIKVIFYHHSSNFDWVYSNYTHFKLLYKSFKNSKYFVSIVPFENDYLFNNWGINSILFDNFMTYEYNSVIPSDLSSNIILMIGRGKAKKKRFKLGIQSMEYIVLENLKYELQIISDLTKIENLQNLVNNLNLNNYIKFVGYSQNPEFFFKNASLNIFPSISEAFPMVIIETKIFGIPNILMGLDYLAISKGGTIIIYDDTPETLSKEALKLLNNKKQRRNLGKQSRKSMKKFKNDDILLKWIELILSVYNGDNYYNLIREKKKKLSKNEILEIINHQVNIFKIRDSSFENITINNYKNFDFMENLK